MGTGPRAVVPPPVKRPPVISLLSSAVDISDDNPDGRWQNGFTFDPEHCGDVIQIVDPCDSETKTTTSDEADVDYEPFDLVANYTCSPFDHNLREWRARAERNLRACMAFGIEDELWTGTKAQEESWPNRFLADVNNVDILTESGPVGLTHGLACLEQALGDCNCGQPGMIHATRQVVTHWMGLDLIRRVEQPRPHLETILGTVVVPGAGYDGSDPDGQPAIDGRVWAYATGMVHVLLGPVRVIPDSFKDALDRTDNTATFFAEASAAAFWDGCCHFGVRLDVTTCDSGGS